MVCAFDRRNPRFRISRAGMTGVALALLVVAPPLAVGTTSGLNVTRLEVPRGSGTTAGLNTTILSVSATINANCTISTNGLSFGQYEALRANATAPLNAAGSVRIACTKGSAPRITLDLGQNPSGATTADGARRRRRPGNGPTLLRDSTSRPIPCPVPDAVFRAALPGVRRQPKPSCPVPRQTARRAVTASAGRSRPDRLWAWVLTLTRSSQR